LDSFHVSTLCGASPKARHTRETVDCDIPRCAAIERVDQCVASFGADSRVSVISRSTCSSVTVRGRPGRGSSANPSRRCSAKRDRQVVTVGRDTSSRAAISVFDRPSAAASTILLRAASPAVEVRRRAQDSSWARSSSVSSIRAGFGPRVAILQPNNRQRFNDSRH
jgi:hypothetical protein